MLQEIASKTLIAQCYNAGSHYTGTCGYMLSTAYRVYREFYGARFKAADVNDTVANDALDTYKEFSGANSDSYGFKCIPCNVWNKMTQREKGRFREDMLYYFWMANQEM